MRQERKDKLQKDSLKLAEDCVQYALLATESAFYPCLNCANKDSVFLLEGEVYKYGYTCNGEKGRYGSAELIKQNLMFWVEFKGNVQECMYMELEKIIHYPLLPEREILMTNKI
ncbi:MAG: hypothetical protein EAZ97_09995 [Bacteroidetes bacterium]|nr:MAG: hypothetical protein EAZ97_09995 [Bacteroidota bacterium]